MNVELLMMRRRERRRRILKGLGIVALVALLGVCYLLGSRT